MTTFLKAAGAFVLGSVFAGGAIASPATDAALNQPEWSESCSLPSAIATSLETRDNDIRLASDNQAVAASSTADQNSCSSCDSCTHCTCCCPPTCYVSAGTVILHRDRPDTGKIIAANPAGTTFFNPSDFDFGWDAGPDITIGYRLGCDDAIEGRFFDDDGAEASTSFRTPGNFIGVGFTGPTNTLFEGRYTTKLYSSELNWRHSMNDQLSFLSGFRWIELADDMDFHLNGNVAEGDYQYNNRLYGGQIGADWALTDPCSRLQINTVGKAGLYGNVTDGGIYEFGGGNFIGKFTGEDNTIASVFELNFTGSYWLTSHVALRGGYQLLWLDNLALASNAASRSLLNPSLLRKVDNDQNLFYQGAIVAIDFAW